MATYQENDTIIASAATNYDTWDLSWADEIVMVISGITANTITVQMSPDGVNFGAVETINMSTRVGDAAAGVISADGIYRIEMNGKKLRFVSSGAESKTIAWSAKSTKRMTSVS